MFGKRTHLLCHEGLVIKEIALFLARRCSKYDAAAPQPTVIVVAAGSLQWFHRLVLLVVPRPLVRSKVD
jgi:hypothetical protein